MKNFRAGEYVQHEFHKSFKPNLLPRKWQIDDIEMIGLLSEASRLVGKLDMYSDYIPDIDLFINMHVAREATLSSKIEGTQTRFEDAMKDEKDIPLEHRDDWKEVQNYIKALNFGIEKLKELPLCGRLVCNTHAYLMEGVRGKHKSPGQFRTSQNWIGGASINDASFVPPHQDYVPELMTDLDKFMNEENPLPPIFKIAIIHYQFETIHPFLDGNGRVGRLMIPLYLMERKILKQPVLYLSDFFERHRDIYYQKLSAVRSTNDIDSWVKFFLVGLIETAQKGIKTFDGILKLKEETAAKIDTLGGRSEKVKKLMNGLYSRPIFGVEGVKKNLEVTTQTAYNILKDMQRIGILKKCGKFYIFQDYINIFEA